MKSCWWLWRSAEWNCSNPIMQCTITFGMCGLLSREIKPHSVVLYDMTNEIIAMLDVWWLPYWGSNFWNPIIQPMKAIKRQQCFGLERTSPQAGTMPTIRTCKEETEILLLFSVLIIIIINITYIGNIHRDCTQFPLAMVEQKFNNEYDIIRWDVSLLLDRFERGNQVFAAQCIQLLASIFQFTKILIHYHNCKVFLSEYVDSLVVSPFSNPAMAGLLISESNIPVLHCNDSDTEVHSGRSNLLPHDQRKKQCRLHTMRSGQTIRQNPDYSNSELHGRFGKQNMMWRCIILNLLRSGDLEY